MPVAQRALIVVLRLLGVWLLLALAAVFLPFSMMAAIHAGLGMGELPAKPIVDYLARSTSFLYAVFGILALFLSCDARRYGALIGFLGLMGIPAGVLMIYVDLTAGLPLFWILLEGPGIIGWSVLIFGLNRAAGAAAGVSRSGYAGSVEDASG